MITKKIEQFVEYGVTFTDEEMGKLNISQGDKFNIKETDDGILLEKYVGIPRCAALRSRAAAALPSHAHPTASARASHTRFCANQRAALPPARRCWSWPATAAR